MQRDNMLKIYYKGQNKIKKQEDFEDIFNNAQKQI